MAHDYQNQGSFPGGPYGFQGYPQNGGPYGPQVSPPAGGAERRVDALDVLEGVLTNGLSLSNFTRIARASGSNFWIGAAIGAGLVVMAHRSEVRSAVANAFAKAKATAAKVGDADKTPGA